MTANISEPDGQQAEVQVSTLVVETTTTTVTTVVETPAADLPEQNGAKAEEEEAFLAFQMSSGDEDEAEEEGAAEASTSEARNPWAKSSRHIRSPLLRLHNEIVEFCRFLAPRPEEAAARTAAKDRIAEVITSIWPEASVEVFGSFVTGLYLPSSDMDLVVMHSKAPNIPAALKALANALVRKGLAKNLQLIAKAKVPIVKFVDIQTDFNFDISFDVANGPEAAQLVRSMMDGMAPMRPLIMVLKVFLQQRELNEVYSGGIGSYALLVMVAAFLLLHPTRQKSQSRRKPGKLEPSLGVLLMDFFRLYGRSLNQTEVGISCRGGGSFFSKAARGFSQEERPFLMSIEDPTDTQNDLGRGSYHIQKVRQAFDFGYQQLTAQALPDESLLRRIIRLDSVLTERPPPPEAPASPAEEKMEEDVGVSGRDDGERPRKEENDKGRPGRQEGGGRPKERWSRERKRQRERSRDRAFRRDDDESPTPDDDGYGRRDHRRWDDREEEGDSRRQRQKKSKQSRRSRS